jgi:hypothetical protein
MCERDKIHTLISWIHHRGREHDLPILTESVGSNNADLKILAFSENQCKNRCLFTTWVNLNKFVKLIFFSLKLPEYLMYLNRFTGQDGKFLFLLFTI